MELIVLIPVIAIMAGAALYFALAEQSPTSARPGRRPRPVLAPTSYGDVERRRRAESHAANLAEADVLLADTLSELIEVKEELSALRSKVAELQGQQEAAPEPAPERPRRVSRRSTRTRTAAHSPA